MKRVVIYLLFLSAFYPTLNAQDLKVPNPSTLQKIEQDFGLGRITVAYSRPNMKGRKIIGGIEPYGIVWRTGANSATKIKLTDTVTIEGHLVAPGEYSLFTIPGAKDWTIIFNKTADQWGAYAYDSTKDVLRFKVKPGKLDKKLETFTIQFANVFTEKCDLQLLWENTIVSMHLTADVDSRVMANIDQAIKGGEKRPFYLYQAAIYYYNHNKDMSKALEWLNVFDKASPGAYNAKYWKARIQLKAGDKKGAIETANEGLKLALA
ncbi:MAG: DUF2911 domain-containing protein, partial [Chitinophagaceae bacterium]